MTGAIAEVFQFGAIYIVTIFVVIFLQLTALASGLELKAYAKAEA